MVDEILPQICDDFRAFAFEASRESYELARRRFAGRDNVTFVHGALCQMLPDDNKIRLYKDGRNGLGNSVLKHNFAEYEEVDAIRLSEWMQEQQLNLENSVCLLRMNIEGSEFDVISDLVNGGLHKFIDGYFGMWDDLSKIDKRRDDEFRALLARNNIRPFTFNGRDLGSNFRLKCIRYDIDTSVRVGLRRLGKSPNKGAGSE
ncbi:MAG: FkbM family methyltransferase [Anaerolineae bacterium]|nr:FkbM family methyltransferase [Anaerolineae bacterium]